MTQPKVYIYWDNSNIFISAKTVCVERGELTPNDIRLNFENLYRLAHAYRPVAKAIAVGSIPPEHQKLWENFKKSGVEIELHERGQYTGKEQGLDACLQVHMLRDLDDNKDIPQIAVLLTGDGAGYKEGVGFHADLERMQKSGWGIEVIAWDRSCRGDLKIWAKTFGCYIKLEDYYDSVTYIKDVRTASQLNLTHRPKSNPKKVLVAESGKKPDAAQITQVAPIKTKDGEEKIQREPNDVNKDPDDELRELRRMEHERNRARNLLDPKHLRKRLRQAKKRAREKKR